MENIRVSTPPDLYSQPDVGMPRNPDFEAAIWMKGYEVILEQAIACPCRGRSGEARPTCQSCLGLGWTFINATETRALITSINYSTKYKDWSPELTGTISITVRDRERLSFMDKVTFKTRRSVLSEIRPIIEVAGRRFVFTSYKPKLINNIFTFVDDSSKLYIVPSSNYSIKEDRNVIEFSSAAQCENNGVVSIDYEHETSYNVIDVPHDFRSAFIINEFGKTVETNLPMQAIARRSHLLMGEPATYNGTDLIDNNSVTMPKGTMFTEAYDVFVGRYMDVIVNGYDHGNGTVMNSEYIIFPGTANRVFSKADRTFWLPGTPIYNTNSRKWLVTDFTQDFLDTYGTESLKARLFFKPYMNNMNSMFPILSYLTDRTAGEILDIQDFLMNNSFIFEHNVFISKSK